MSEIQVQEVLERVVLVQVVLNAYGGATALAEDEVPDNGGDVVRWGNKYVVDPKALRPVGKFRQAVKRVCTMHATRMMEAWGCPVENIQTLLSDLSLIKQQFEDFSAEFVREFPRLNQEWANHKPEWRDSILAAAPEQSFIASRFGFRVGAYSINPAQVTGAGTLIEDEVFGLAGQVAKEIAQDIKDAFRLGITNCTTKSFGPLERARDKARSFGFLDPALIALVDLVNEGLGALRKTGEFRLSGVDLLLLQGLVGIMENPSKILALKPGDSIKQLVEPAAKEPDLFEVQEAVVVTPASTNIVVPEVDVNLVRQNLLSQTASFGSFKF